MSLLLEHAKQTILLVGSMKEELVSFFKNEINDFDERWEHYLTWVELGGEAKSWTYCEWDGLIDGLDDIFYHDGIVRTERYQTIELLEVLDRVVEHLAKHHPEYLKEYGELVTDENYEEILEFLDNKYFHEEITKLKNQLMLDGISRFVFDW